MERRTSPRINEPFIAQVAGQDRGGKPFDFATVLDNISSGGLYFSFPREMCSARTPVEVGAQLHFTVDISYECEIVAQGSRLVAEGEVLRLDLMESGTCGVAIKFIDRQTVQ
jgi:hypothetical protein